MKQKDIFFLSVSSCILVVVWMLFNLWHIKSTSKLSETIVMQSTPISPNFDTQALDKLKTREKIEPIFTLKKVATNSAITIIPTP